MCDQNPIRIRLAVRGRVQGVGFRPAVYRLATDLGLTGLVGNDSQGAFIEVQGEVETVEQFATDLPSALPVRAVITDLRRETVPLLDEHDFQIDLSRAGGEQEAEISPDIATCADCRRELFDPADRRYRYAFINCTNCGPRYSIVQGVPYDREQTTMRSFPMCPECQREYDDPRNRRFHAQPNACPKCGPTVQFIDAAGNSPAGDPIRRAVAGLEAGKIIAIKGLGGFHLACDATNDTAVQRLRERKGRESKPLAMMVRDPAAAHSLADLDESGINLLCSWRAPIVLAPQKTSAPVSDQVAPDTCTFGIMLPYTPLHLLLFAEHRGPLVMTSANPTDEPLCAANEEAVQRLQGIADGFLLHDREIARRVDDSVIAAALPTAGDTLPVRRSRGYVPEPIRLPTAAAAPILAVGGDLKSALCMVQGRDAVMSEHLGELANPAAYRNFVQAVDCFREILGVAPEQVVCDLHPRYQSARYAHSLGLPVLDVQHHYAHAMAAMLEHQLTGPVLALCADGTGYGTDGNIWGCELLVADPFGFRRVGHLRSFPLIGGDAAARDTWRPAAALLADSLPADRFNEVDPGEQVDADAWGFLQKQLARNAPRTLRTSSLGRLFDAVAWICGLRGQNRFEADAAMTLEAAAAECTTEPKPLHFDLACINGTRQLDYRPLIRDLLQRRQGGEEAAGLARAFHTALATALVKQIVACSRTEGIGQVVLSGGCFLNCLLTAKVQAGLARAEIQTYSHRMVPTGDGGLALGQAWIALCRQLRNDH